MFVSVLGDSIGTFAGYAQANYPVFYTSEKNAELGLSSVEDTWWIQLIEAQDWRFLKNASYSGQKVIESGFGYGIAEQQAFLLRTEDADPDIILVYMGVNDFACGIPDHWFPRRESNENFHKSLCEMLCRLRNMYPDAQILCGTLMRTTVKNKSDWVFPERFGGRPFDKYNLAIREAVEHEHCTLVDLVATGIRYETLDGVHPDQKGHADIAKAWKICLDSTVLN